MSNSYNDATGVLLFDGPAKVTDVISMLFKPFNLAPAPDEGDAAAYIAILSEETSQSWDGYADEIVEIGRAQLGINFGDALTPEEIVACLGRKFGRDLAPYIASVDFDCDVTIGDVVSLAKQCNDGHNLIGFSIEGCWHADRAGLWEFGGYMSFEATHYAFSLSTSDLKNHAVGMNAQLASGTDAPAQALHSLLTRLLSGIKDAKSRRDVVSQLAASLSNDALATC